MPRLQEKRAEETKAAIVAAAKQLFGEKGYEAVTMREIAKEAGCSHTTIYIYFKDKETLLHHLSVPPLEELRGRMETAASEPGASAVERMQKLSRVFIEFCLGNRGLYGIFFGVNSERVDTASPSSEINRLRLGLFNLLRRTLGEALGLPDGERLLACSRIYFYQIHGIAATYSHSKESADALMERLTPTFDEAVAVLMLGFNALQSNKEVGKQ
ncbi:hypothetical protein SD70_17465 [Gordoniibacillus kamchatkensis]|uniref:HTH tetR-type domain-containing protein n=1 Tax=Gordoniibacillus kamchatkensis TaxID=1590651 RepID=A0ABR5AFL7_9BACL|nr:TetR/AcrR family transcriptional regulator [Paenibacillus sp. VKM B-2647]KIL39851.1 hypothetical protein SD70_17465 [Paenibacillus sp. VKM B-2647]